MPVDYLPETSFVVTNTNDEVIAFASLYLTNSPFSVLEWVTANPNLDKEEKGSVLNFLLTKIKESASELGCKMIQTSTRIQPLVDRLKNEHNYFEHDKNLTALLTAVDYNEVAKNYE